MAMNLAILGSQPSFAGAKRGVVRARRLGMIVAFNTTDFVMVKVEPASKPSAANVPGKWDDVCCFKHPNVTRW